MFRSLVRTNVRNTRRWSSIAAHSAEPKRISGNGQGGGSAVSIGAMVGLAGGIALFYHYSGDSKYEKDLKKRAAERNATGEKRADPLRIQNDIQEFLRLLDPESASQIVQIGVKLCTRGLDATVEANEYYPFLKKMKDENTIMSWADIGALIAHCALIEMGSPMIGLKQKFGRIDGHRKGGTIPVPSPDTTDPSELIAYGAQFGLTDAETVALFGGQQAGSLLLGDTKEAMISTVNYSKIARHKTNPCDLSEIPYGRALANSEYFVKCCEVFDEEPLRWNRFFARALVKVFESGWSNLVELPKRMRGTTRDMSWSARQAEVYGVHQPYEGSSRLREK